MRSKGRYLFFILMAVVWMGAACMLLGILLTRQHIPQKTMAQVTKAPIEKKTAYLTFDDGPTTKATAKILDILKEENVDMNKLNLHMTYPMNPSKVIKL